MCDTRHAPDTLFFVSEEDWRVYPEDEEVDAEAVAREVFERHGGKPLSVFAEQLNQPPPRPMASLSRAYDSVTGEPFAPETHTGPPQDSSSAGVEPLQEGWEQVAGCLYTRPRKAAA